MAVLKMALRFDVYSAVRGVEVEQLESDEQVDHEPFTAP